MVMEEHLGIPSRMLEMQRIKGGKSAMKRYHLLELVRNRWSTDKIEFFKVVIYRQFI
jgi:hypothetical protein